MLEKHEIWYWLSTLMNVGNSHIAALLDRFGDEEAVFEAQSGDICEIIGDTCGEEFVEKRDEEQIKREYFALVKRGIRLILRDEEDFPEKLRGIPNPPYYIYLLGNLPKQNAPSIAIIGSRGCSEYGRELTGYFSEGLAAAGVGIISGLALGIDAEAHKGALRQGGYTLGVIGCGIGDVYPRANWQLFDIMERKGGIISEYPPGKPALKASFPLRNRLISGMADGVLVIEARTKSGTLHTVDHALSQSKDVFAVPGRLHDPMSEGCNSLIKQGAQLVTDVSDILLSIWGIESVEDGRRVSLSRRREQFYKAHREELGRKEWIVFGRIGTVPVSIGELAEKTSLSVSDISSAVFKLTEKGFVKDINGFYVANMMF